MASAGTGRDYRHPAYSRSNAERAAYFGSEPIIFVASLLTEERVDGCFAAAVPTDKLFLQVVLDVMQGAPFR
jgi:hypothetical protein